MPTDLDTAFRRRRFLEEVTPELNLASGLRLAAARQPLQVSGAELTGGFRGPDLGRLARTQTGQASGLSSALGRVVGQEQGLRTQEEIRARQAFMDARAQEQEQINAGAQGVAREISTLGGQAIRGGTAAAGVPVPGGELDEDARRALQLRRLQSFGSAFGGG